MGYVSVTRACSWLLCLYTCAADMHCCRCRTNAAYALLLLAEALRPDQTHAVVTVFGVQAPQEAHHHHPQDAHSHQRAAVAAAAAPRLQHHHLQVRLGRAAARLTGWRRGPEFWPSCLAAFATCAGTPRPLGSCHRHMAAAHARTSWQLSTSLLAQNPSQALLAG